MSTYLVEKGGWHHVMFRSKGLDGDYPITKTRQKRLAEEHSRKVNAALEQHNQKINHEAPKQ